jgi:hypothetical protein
MIRSRLVSEQLNILAAKNQGNLLHTLAKTLRRSLAKVRNVNTTLNKELPKLLKSVIGYPKLNG